MSPGSPDFKTMNQTARGTDFRRRKISDMIAEDLRRWIAQENMKPGDRLPNERALLEHYNCSKGTMREALKALEVQGLLKMVTGPNGGPEVRTVSLDVIMQQLRTFLHFQSFNFEQVYSLRQSLEVMLATSVVGTLTEEHLAELQANIDTFEQFRAQGDLQGARRTELEFHDILTKASDNPILAFICRFINGLLRDLVQYRSEKHRDHDDFGDHNIESHKLLLSAYRKRDVGEVERLMADHMHCAARFMERLDAQLGTDLLSDAP